MDVTTAIFDPELGCTGFTVEQITYTNSRTGTTKRSVTAQAMGCIHPGTPEMVQLLPEEEKGKVFIAVYTDTALTTGDSSANSHQYRGADRIGWKSKTWRVVRVRDWQSFGYYQALAVEMNEGE